MPRADPERLAAWEAALTALARADQDVGEALTRERGRDLATYRVLGRLVAAGGRLRMHELADELVVGRPTLSRMCDRIEHEGWIRRERLAEDGRAVFVVLTREGREEYRRCQPAYERFVQATFGRFVSDADVAALSRIAGKLG